MTRTSLTELREEMRAVARGERQSSPLLAAPVLAALSRDALDLLGILLRERPPSVSALAALTGRSQPNVSRSLQLLAKHRLIRLMREGREVRPEPIASVLHIDPATGDFALVGSMTRERPVTMIRSPAHMASGRPSRVFSTGSTTSAECGCRAQPDRLVRR